MSEKSPFEIVDGQVILHDEFQGIDKTILNYEQVAAIKLLIQKYSSKGHDQYNESTTTMYFLGFYSFLFGVKSRF